MQIDIKNVRQITVNVTAEEWGLFTSESASVYVAKELSEAVARTLNRNLSRAVALQVIMESFESNVELGAMDTEPLAMLDSIMDHFYAGFSS